MSTDFSLMKYEKKDKSWWDNHVRNSKNPYFFFLRDFIEYHKERFDEHSLIIRKGKKIVAVLPGNISEDTYYSYQGLTFGGLIVSDKVRAANTGQIIDQVKAYLRNIGIVRMVYKKMPYIYNVLPYEEDVYHLFKEGAKVNSAEIGQVIDYRNYKISSTRKNEISRAESHGITIHEHRDFAGFWEILENNLNKHGASPTHSLEEISYLASKFPKNIKLFCAQKEEQLLCGTVLFLNKNTVHTQYIGSSPESHQYFALEYLLHTMIEKFKDKSYFSFGISTEEKGKTLNEGLAFFKEGFGSRGILNMTFEVQIQ